jgi:hypothetical protein
MERKKVQCITRVVETKLAQMENGLQRVLPSLQSLGESQPTRGQHLVRSGRLPHYLRLLVPTLFYCEFLPERRNDPSFPKRQSILYAVPEKMRGG